VIKKYFVFSLAFACFCYAYSAALLYQSQSRMFNQPRTEKPDKAQWGAEDLKTVHVTTEDGLALSGWYASPVNKDLPVIVFFHGNGQHIGTSYKDRMDFFVKRGHGLLMVEYRGYGGHAGIVHEQGLYRDAQAFVKWLHDEQSVAYCDMVFFGESLGTSLAVHLAAINHPRTVILLAPFSSIFHMVQDKYFYMPVQVLLKDQYRNDLKIKNINAPLLIVHGEKDKIVPIKYGKSLYEQAIQPKAFFSFAQGNHINLFGSEAREQIVDFMNDQGGNCSNSKEI